MLSGVTGEVTLANDADDTVAVAYYRKPPYLVTRHRPHAIFNRIVHVARKCFVGHAVIDERAPDVHAARD
jgi:hypothetical protein